MRRLLPILLLATAVAASATEQPWYPDDFTPQPCAPENVCTSFSVVNIRSASARYLGLSLDDTWLTKNDTAMKRYIAPQCRKIASCFATPGTTSAFCNDVVMPELRATCEKNFTDPKDREQCRIYIEIFALGMDQWSRPVFAETQKCVTAAAPAKKSTPPVVWMQPKTIPRGYKGEVMIFALDPETKIPVPGKIAVEGQVLWSRPNPEGVLATFYGFKWPIKYRRVPNAAGHTDLVAPMVTVTFDHYPEVKFRMPIEPPKMLVSMQPSTLKRGRNTITITAKDAETGAPVEARVMLGDRVLGETNKPFALELKRGEKLPQIWVTSLFDAYSDVVVK